MTIEMQKKQKNKHSVDCTCLICTPLISVENLIFAFKASCFVTRCLYFLLMSPFNGSAVFFGPSQPQSSHLRSDWGTGDTVNPVLAFQNN